MRGGRGKSWWSRAAEWLIAAWAVVALVTPVALPTLVARGASAHAAPGQMAARTPMRGAEMSCDGAMHAPAASPRHATGHGRPQGGDHACCTCFGPCCHAAPAVFARAPEAPHVSVALVPPRPPVPAVRVRYYPTAPEHARPPSIGPPVGLPV